MLMNAFRRPAIFGKGHNYDISGCKITLFFSNTIIKRKEKSDKSQILIKYNT